MDFFCIWRRIMNRLKISFIFLIVILFIFACASTKQVEKKPPFKFEGPILTKGIDTKGTIGTATEPTITFNTEDSEAIALLKFANLSGKHNLRWEWYDPAGKLYYSTGNFPIRTSRGKYLKKASAWHRISIQGDPAVNYPGNWEVRVFLDGELIESKSFVLTRLTDVVKLSEDIGAKPYPKDWGLIIGIENYAHLPSVDYARKDALIIKDYFIRVMGVPEENIISIIDNDATKARIEGYLKQYIPSNVEKGSTLYVYFAGHGYPDMKKGDPYLVPYDGDTKFIEQTGYKLRSFYQDLDNLKIKRVYVFLDSCFSGGAARAAEMLTKGARPVLVHKDVSLSSTAVVSLSASSGGQTSNSYPEKKHGLFTYFLLRAFKGEADANDDGWLTMQEVYGYVKKHVTRVSRRMATEQTPVITPSLNKLTDIAISGVPR